MNVERIYNEANCILTHRTTIRQTALLFNVSKSTVHKDVSIRLKHLDLSLYEKVNQILQQNFNQKHLRGGLATKNKFLKRKNK